jgi:signal transduction histidine kinase
MYAQYRERLPHALVERRDVRAEWRRQFGYVFDDCVQSLRQGRVALNKERVALASVLGVTTALSGVSLEKLNVAWGEMGDVFLATPNGFASGRLVSTGKTQLALKSINRSIVERGKVSSFWYEKALLKRFEKIRMADRKRMARELHDWFGGNLSLALRKLELHDLATQSGDDSRENSGADRRHITDLHAILADLLEGSRRLSSGLRLQNPVSSIDGELRSFVDSFGSDLTDVTILVDGDESSVPSHVRGELFMMLRESLRNIFTHSGASKAFVIVHVRASLIRGVVQDDGRGFDTAVDTTSPRAGTGLISMKERIRALGGSFTLASAPMSGTRISFLIPNPAKSDGGPHDLA